MRKYTASDEIKMQQMREKVAREFASGGVRPDEVVLREDGAVVIDRRATIPWAKPLVVGEWR